MNDPEYTAVLANVVKHFKSGPVLVRAVDGVSLQLPRGKMVALRGPSGCGKSTLLNLFGALDRPDSGDIVVDGIDVGRLKGGDEVDYRRRKVGFVFQMFNLMPSLTALENVMLPMELAGGMGPAARKQKAESLLERVKLAPDRYTRRPTRLSGGEQQRVAIARALANDPALILADEPTANLDSTTGGQVISLLRRLADDKRTVVVATHDNSIAQKADVVISMSDGKLMGKWAEEDSEAESARVSS
ncbi:MAG: ABC transporter ATP-binding protein [Dehalococcoidia bacterium]|nr:ABC transporter ATP-binding protein [Dehalococcoidia bacterium]